MTAIDIASQIKRLGAEDVTIVYRRGAADMGASPYEQEVAQTTGVLIRHWAAPTAIVSEAGKVTGDGWTAPSRVLLAMDAKGVVHGIGATGTLMVTPGEDGMTAVMLSAGQPEEDVVQVPTTSALSSTAPRLTSEKWHPDYAYVAYGSTVRCPAHG